jgi:hypothetical protein
LDFIYYVPFFFFLFLFGEEPLGALRFGQTESERIVKKPDRNAKVTPVPTQSKSIPTRSSQLGLHFTVCILGVPGL